VMLPVVMLKARATSRISFAIRSLLLLNAMLTLHVGRTWGHSIRGTKPLLVEMNGHRPKPTYKQEAPKGTLQGFYRNWCASAFAGWGRMRFSQTHNMRIGSRLQTASMGADLEYTKVLR